MFVHRFIPSTPARLKRALVARRRSLTWALGVLMTSAAGCARPAGPIFEPPATPISWPGPPDEPRIHYVGQLSTSADLKAARPLGDAIHDALFGRKPVMGMLHPFAVESDQRDRLFVADSGGRVVHVFDLARRKYEQWSPAPSAGFVNPVGLARAADGRLFVADSAASLIWIFDAAGNVLDAWGQDELIRPCGMAYDDTTSTLFVADAGNHQVVLFDRAGQPFARIGGRGTALGQFNFPVDVLIDHRGRLYVSDSLNCRIQQFVPERADGAGDAGDSRMPVASTLQYVPRLQIGSRGDMPGYFSRPKGIAVDREDHLYVIDAQFEAVQVYSSEGVLLMAFGREGRGPGEFWLPSGIHIDSSDRLWIADTFNQRIQVFDYRAPASERAPESGVGEVLP